MRHDEKPFAADAEFADDGLVRAARHLGDFALGFAIAVIQARDAHGHAVAMHGAFAFFLGQVDVALDAGDGLIGDDKAEAVAMDAEASFNQGSAGLLGRTARLSTGMRSRLRRRPLAAARVTRLHAPL